MKNEDKVKLAKAYSSNKYIKHLLTSGITIDDIMKTDEVYRAKLKNSKYKAIGQGMIGIYINYTDMIYIFCPVSKRIYYSTIDNIVIERMSSFHMNEFIKRLKLKKLV